MQITNIPINQLANVQRQLTLKWSKFQQMIGKKAALVNVCPVRSWYLRLGLGWRVITLCETVQIRRHMSALMCRMSSSNMYISNGSNNITANNANQSYQVNNTLPINSLTLTSSFNAVNSITMFQTGI